MHELTYFEIAPFCVLILMYSLALVLKWISRGTRYQKEATVLLFIVDILFTGGLYFLYCIKNPSADTVTFVGITIFILGVIYYKARKFYLHKYY